jgi:hypothetical protein
MNKTVTKVNLKFVEAVVESSMSMCKELFACKTASPSALPSDTAAVM